MAHVIQLENNAKSVSSNYAWLISLIVAFGGFLFGFDTAIISGALPLVKEQFSLSTAMEGWFVSAALVGCITGVAFSGYLSDRFGRKQILLLSAVLFIASSIGCMFPSTIEMLITFRLVGGIGIGIASMLAPLYISEFAPLQIRGRLVSFYQLAITIGIVAAYFSNAYLLGFQQKENIYGFLNLILVKETWRAMLGINVIPAIIFFILLLYVPQTPRWLVKKGFIDEALIVLKKAVGEKEARQEISDIKESFNTVSPGLKILLQPGYRKALLIGVLLPFLGQFSGINAIIYYGPRILNQGGLTLSSSLDGQVTIGIINVLSTFLAIKYVDKLGRRPLLIFGTTGIIVALLIAAVLFYLKLTSGYAVIITILFFIFCYAFSLGPVQWVIMSEIYPNQIRAKAMTVATMSLWIAATVVAQIFPWMLETIGAQGAFLFFAACSACTIILTIKAIPETKNKSLEEIEAFWKKG
ncbi:sugar porter family MFS transporter [Segetibacter koreensis]|uniref:sugar porter family MFS transporter n=1 Tax=Segetibacter koreensis TaxID=398037 RepID=UPI000361FFD1|nr:sugar porter family MFS transporter [Segetibacter koreensis]